MLFLKFDQPDMLLSKGIHKPIFSTCLCKAQIWDSDLITNLRMSYFHWIYFSNMLTCFSRVSLFETPWTVACSLPGFSVHGVLQARILEWVAVSSFRGSSWPRDWTHVSSFSCTGRQVLYHSCRLGSPTSPIPWRNRRAGKGPRESPMGALGWDFLHWVCLGLGGWLWGLTTGGPVLPAGQGPSHPSTACGHTHVLFMSLGWYVFISTVPLKKMGRIFYCWGVNLHWICGILPMAFREGNGHPLQYSCLGNPKDGGASWATVHGVAKRRTQLSD